MGRGPCAPPVLPLPPGVPPTQRVTFSAGRPPKNREHRQHERVRRVTPAPHVSSRGEEHRAGRCWTTAVPEELRPSACLTTAGCRLSLSPDPVDAAEVDVQGGDPGGRDGMRFSNQTVALGIQGEASNDLKSPSPANTESLIKNVKKLYWKIFIVLIFAWLLFGGTLVHTT